MIKKYFSGKFIVAKTLKKPFLITFYFVYIPHIFLFFPLPMGAGLLKALPGIEPGGNRYT
jgi:hypothetical protein